MITLLNGSPHNNGHTMSVTKQLLADTTNIRQFNTYEMDVDSCDDCKLCIYQPRCKFKDDMTVFYDTINLSDTLIISSPIYFGTLSDQALQVINRLQVYYNQKFEAKNTLTTLNHIIFVVSQGSDKPYMHQGVYHIAKILGKLFDAKTHVLPILDTDHLKDLTKETKKQLFEIKDACSL